MLRDLPGTTVAVDGFSLNRYGSWRGRGVTVQLFASGDRGVPSTGGGLNLLYY